MTLTGNLVTLREYVPSDAAAMTAWTSDPEVSRYLTWPVGDYERAVAFIEKTIAQAHEEPRTVYEFAILERFTDQVVGSAGIRVRDPQTRRADLGYVLRRDRWGQGYMTEAVRLLIRFGFDRLHMHRIEATCHPSNDASARVMMKNGMQFEGRLRHLQCKDGEWWDSLMYATIEGDAAR
jgi:[ribosomal protein S5]-alanine N-acetyltransferase